jgi:hypothetical protein
LSITNTQQCLTGEPHLDEESYRYMDLTMDPVRGEASADDDFVVQRLCVMHGA